MTYFIEYSCKTSPSGEAGGQARHDIRATAWMKQDIRGKRPDKAGYTGQTS